MNYDHIVVIETVEREIRSVTNLHGYTMEEAVALADFLLRKYMGEIGCDLEEAVEDGEAVLPTAENLNGYSNMRNTNYDVHIITSDDSRFDDPEILQGEVG